MINPFKRSKDYPQTESEEKWEFVGFFKSFLVFFIIAFPLLVLTGQVRYVTELSLPWFALMISLIVWPLSFMFTLKWWLQMAHNFGLFMFKMEQQGERKKFDNYGKKVEKETK